MKPHRTDMVSLDLRADLPGAGRLVVRQPGCWAVLPALDGLAAGQARWSVVGLLGVIGALTAPRRPRTPARISRRPGPRTGSAAAGPR